MGLTVTRERTLGTPVTCAIVAAAKSGKWHTYIGNHRKLRMNVTITHDNIFTYFLLVACTIRNFVQFSLRSKMQMSINTVQSDYNTVTRLQNAHNRHTIGHLGVGSIRYISCESQCYTHIVLKLT